MVTFANRAKVSTSTTGTGTITLGTAVDGYQSFADAGVVNSDVVRYTIEDGDAWEIGSGTYSAGTLTRVLDESSTGSLLNLSGDAVVYVTAAGEDIVQPSDLATVATTGAYSDLSGLPTLGTAAAADTGDFATAAQGSLADSAVQPNDSPTFGSVTVTGTVDGRDVAADGSKLDGIEAGADVTDAGNVNPLVDAHLNYSTATTGQVLSYNGADYDWITVSGYTDGDVDTHLNTSTASSGEVLSWTGSDYDWVAVSAGAFSIDASRNVYSVATIPAITTGSDNLFYGSLAGDEITSGTDNIGLGRQSLNYVTTGIRNVAVGLGALGGSSGSKLTGSYNIGLGYLTGFSLSTGTNNFMAGDRAGNDLTSGSNNFLGGRFSGTNLTTGSNNVALGNGALDAATTGGRNVAIGQDAMGAGVATASTGDNIAIGYRSGYDLTSGTDNLFIGDLAGTNITTASNNIALGANALDSATTGGRNIAIGLNAMGAAPATSSNGDNITIGVQSGDAISTGTDNALIGTLAGYLVSSGSSNVLLGNNTALTLTTGSGNVVLGSFAEPSSATVSNEITLGNTSVTRFRIPGAGIDNTSAALSGTTPSVNVGARDTYTLTTSGNTTFTFTGAPSSGQVGTFSLIITAGGTHTLTWPASVDWAGGTAPDAPASGEKDIYTFMTVDGGTTWYGFLAGDAMA